MPSLEGAEMKNWRKMVGALCIVLAMVLGAFAGFAYALNAGIVGASPGAGTRDAGGASGPIAFSEETPETPASSGDTSLASSDSVVASAADTFRATSCPSDAILRPGRLCRWALR